jgi:ABC-type glycerol-3-phosphate transport system substrate-binding protein
MRSCRWKVSAVVALVVAAVAGALAATTGRAGGPVTIEVWDWGSPPPSAFKVLDATYMKSHPGIVIKRVHQPFNSYFTLMRTTIAAHKGPDVFENYASPYVFDYYRGLLPLDKLVKPADRKNLIGWNYVSTGLSNSGTPYAVPWSGQGINFYYNKPLFKKAGLNPTSPPRTWAQLLADCAKLKQAGIVPIVAGFKDGYYAEWWTDVLSLQYMTRPQLEASYAKPSWTTPAIKKALGLLVDLYKKGYMTPNAEAVPLFPDTVNNFGAGKGAIFLGLSANNANYSEFRKDKVSPSLGAFLPPLVPGSKLKSPQFDFGPGLSWTITRWSKNPTQAYDYLSWLSSAKSQEQIFKLSGTFPNNKLSQPITSDKVGQQILGWIRQYPTYLGQVQLIRSNVEVVFDKVVPGMMTGQTSLSSALGQVQAEQQRATPIPTH